jgi:hypothetical protein
MAAGASVTWTHCSVLFEVTWDKTRASTRTGCVRTDALASARTHSLPSPSPSLPSTVPASARTRKKLKIKKNLFFIFLFLVVVAGLEREKKFTIFGFQSPKSPNSPNSPNSPSPASFAGEAARRRRFFRPSSPSHPSKLYTSLGWLNSKVPKPFPPFSLRLIDVDGF